MEGCAVVVGSGPAGLSAALYLSANGMHVMVIDRLSDSGFKRYHSVCGDSLCEGTGAKQKPFRKINQLILHIAFQSCNQLYILLEKLFK